MGQMAAMAQDHWKTWLPKAYAAIPEADRPAFFQGLEDDAAQQIADLADSLTEPPTPGETYPDTQARLAVGESLARQQIFREVLLIPPEPEAMEPDSTAPQIEASLQQAMEDFQDAQTDLVPEN